MLESRTCLLPMIGASEIELLRLHNHYEKSRFPFPGGLYDQPNLYLEGMEILGVAFADIANSKTKHGRH